MTVGEKIKTLRKATGFTQTELGKKLGVQKNAVSKWECGKIEDIPRSKLNTMASFFGVTTSYLIDDEMSVPPAIDDFMSALQDATKDLTEKDKQILLFMARQFNNDWKAEDKIEID